MVLKKKKKSKEKKTGKINYAQDIRIDPEALDVEWLKQPDIELKYIEAVAELAKEKDYAHEAVKTIRSELIQEANENPEDCCGKERPNAGDIEAYYRTHKKYKKARKEMIELEAELQVLTDMKDMIHFTRTKSLENLVKLHGEGYFAGPSVPRNLIREANNWEKRRKRQTAFKDERRKRVDKAVGRKLRRKKDDS